MRRRGLRVTLVALVGLAAASLLALPSRAADPADGGGETGTDAVKPSLVWHGPRDRRVVALTFDDGYAPWNVRRIVRILGEEGIRATFFLNGANTHRDAALWREIGLAGHAIGNHTYFHRDATTMSADQLVTDLVYNRRVVEAATGRSMAPIFRPPYGRRNAATDAAAAAAGFPIVVMWDASAGDATHTPRASASIRAATRGRAGSIVLMHAGPSLTPRILREVIRTYRDRGFEFVTVPELLGLPDAAGGSGPASGQAGPSEASCGPRVPRLECAPDDGVVPAPPPGDDLEGGAAAEAEQPGPAPPAPRRTPVPDRPPARESAWARGPGAESSVAILTVGLLASLLAAGVLAGRRRGRGRMARPPSA